MTQTIFTGTSSNGDVQSALESAIGAAKDGLKSDYVRWELIKVTGEDGGFVGVRLVTVTISATVKS